MQAGERQRLGGQQVQPPGRVQRRVQHGGRGERGRDRQPVPHVAHPAAADLGVHGQQQRLVARRLGPLDQVLARAPVPPHVQLEPLRAVRDLLRQLLDRGRAHRRQPVGEPAGGRGPAPCPLALVVHHPGEPGRGQHERHRPGPAEHGGAGVHLAHVVQHLGLELDPGERPPGPAQRDLLLGRPVGVVEHGPRHPAPGNRPQVADRVRAAEPPLDRVQRDPLGLQQRLEFRPPGPPPASQCATLLLVPASLSPARTDPQDQVSRSRRPAPHPESRRPGGGRCSRG